MAEHVEVVIKIPKYYLTHPQDYSCLAECVRRGVPLPKGHKRLIEDDFLTVTDIKEDGREVTYVLYDEIANASTIIEADKESEE